MLIHWSHWNGEEPSARQAEALMDACEELERERDEARALARHYWHLCSDLPEVEGMLDDPAKYPWLKE